MDANLGIAKNIRTALWGSYNMVVVGSGKEALEEIQKDVFNLVIIGVNVLDMAHGIETLKSVKQYKQKLPVIMISVLDSIRAAIYIIKLGADDYISMPFSDADIKNFGRRQY